MHKCLISILLLFAIPAFAKYQVPDSPHQSVNESELIQLDLYKQLCKNYQKINADTNLHYGSLAIELAKKKEDLSIQSEILLAMEMVHLDQTDLSKSEELLNESFVISHFFKDTSLMAASAIGLGLQSWKLGKNDLAIKHFQDAHNWAVISQNEKIDLYALNNLGLLSNQSGRSHEAILYFQKAAQTSKRLNNQEGQVLAILNLALSHKALARHDSALLNFKEVMPMLKATKNMDRLAKVYFNITDVYNQQGHYEKAIASSNEGLKICRDFDFKETELLGLFGKANIFLASNNNVLAIKTAKEGIVKAEKVGKLSMDTNFHQVLAKAYGKEKESQVMLLTQRTRAAIMISLALLFLMIVAALLYNARQKTSNVNLKLEEKVAERTKELNATNRQLMQSNEELKRFTFIASHDLKEPLRNMGGFISLIKRRIRKQDYESLSEYIEFVEKGNLQMVDLVENVLEFSKLESNEKAKKSKVDIQELLTNLSNLFSNTERKIEIIHEQLPTIYASSSLIKLVLKNLIENAIKYNKSESPKIQIRHQVEGDQFQLYIKDNGIGIAPEYHEKIFGMFVRLHNRGAYKGSGMGLAFVKKLLVNNDGDIRVESEEGKGSTFIVSLTANVLPDDNPNYAGQREGTTLTKESESPRRATQ